MKYLEAATFGAAVATYIFLLLGAGPAKLPVAVASPVEDIAFDPELDEQFRLRFHKLRKYESEEMLRESNERILQRERNIK